MSFSRDGLTNSLFFCSHNSEKQYALRIISHLPYSEIQNGQLKLLDWRKPMKKVSKQKQTTLIPQQQLQPSLSIPLNKILNLFLYKSDKSNCLTYFLGQVTKIYKYVDTLKKICNHALNGSDRNHPSC